VTGLIFFSGWFSNYWPAKTYPLMQ